MSGIDSLVSEAFDFSLFVKFSLFKLTANRSKCPICNEIVLRLLDYLSY